MTDRKLKKLLREKPFLIDAHFSMTATEAKAMMAEMGPLSIEDMLIKARQKDGWKPEFEQLIRRILADTPTAHWNRLRVRLQAGLHHAWVFHAKAVVTWIVILLLSAVMVFTPVGKAVADEISRFIVEIMDGFILIQTVPDEHATTDSVSDKNAALAETASTSVSTPDSIEMEYSSLDDFVLDTGLHPVCLQGGDYEITSIVFYYVPGAIQLLETSYISNDGILIMIWQDWSADNEQRIIEDEDDIVIQTTILDGIQIIGYYDAENGEFNATAILPDSKLGIAYSGEKDFNTILKSLKSQ